LLKAYIDRINDINPALNCFVENRFKDALQEAKEADELIESGTMTEKELATEKPLLGVPFTTKDCIMVKGKKTTHKQVIEAFGLIMSYFKNTGYTA